MGRFPVGQAGDEPASAPTAGWAAVGGVPLLTFLVALTGGTLAWLVLAAIGRDRSTRRLALPAVAVVAAAGVAAAGAALPVDPASGRPTAVVAAVQGDVPHARNLPQLLNDSVVTQDRARPPPKLAAQVRAGHRPEPDIVIWPENSTNLDPFFYPAIYQEVSGAVADGRPSWSGRY